MGIGELCLTVIPFSPFLSLTFQLTQCVSFCRSLCLCLCLRLYLPSSPIHVDRLVEDSKEADLWLINTCTVKNPSEMAMVNIVDKGKQLEKPMVVAGCVPQGEKGIKGLESTTLLGVSQIDRVVEAVEETLQGNTVQLLAKKELPRLDLPKVRRNKHIEIIPLSTGCLGSCTYCKTKHARGELGSYDPEAIVSRAKQAALDPEVREVWLSSEDTGAYGRDIGIKLPYLLRRIVEVLPKDGRTRLRVGMTNPPFMLDSLEEIAQVLNHPLVFAYLHIPVQSGSNKVLKDMNREYTVEEFRECADTLLRLVPDLELATDIICKYLSLSLSLSQRSGLFIYYFFFWVFKANAKNTFLFASFPSTLSVCVCVCVFFVHFL